MSLYLSRVEEKYIIPAGDANIIREHFLSLFDPDKHSKEDRSYQVESYYYDDNEHKAYYEKINGEAGRFKLRYRGYEGGEDLFLEIKLKNNKESIKHRLSRIKKIDIKARNKVALEALGTFAKTYHKPICKISYKRFAVEWGHGVRITLDSDLMVTPLNMYGVSESFNFLMKECVLEIKSYRGASPTFLMNFLKMNNIRKKTFSKYISALDYLEHNLGYRK
jgi:hypothetical protein